MHIALTRDVPSHSCIFQGLELLLGELLKAILDVEASLHRAWRMQNQMALALPAIACIFTGEHLHEYIVPMALRCDRAFLSMGLRRGVPGLGAGSGKGVGKIDGWSGVGGGVCGRQDALTLLCLVQGNTCNLTSCPWPCG